jgi:uncharacterized protein (DUF2126 family)
MDRRTRLARLLLLLAALGSAYMLSRHWPTDQSVHIVLGDAAPRVLELRVRYAELTSAHDDWQREVSFHYAAGRAPRIVNHEPRLVSGDYDVEIEIERTAEPPDARTVSVTRHVTFDGHTMSIDVSAAALAREIPEGAAKAR